MIEEGATIEMDAAYVLKDVGDGKKQSGESAEVIDRGSIPFSLTLKDESECSVESSSGDNPPEGENGGGEEQGGYSQPNSN